MLYELEILEARRIADLATDLRKARDRLLQSVPEADLGEPTPARGVHNAAATLALNGVLATTPEFVALRDALAALPRDLQEKLWVTTQLGHGDLAINDWEQGLRDAADLADDALASRLLTEPDLHDCLRKGLYELGMAALPGDAPQ